MANTVDATTVLVAAFRERVAALRTAVDPTGPWEGVPAQGDDDDPAPLDAVEHRGAEDRRLALYEALSALDGFLTGTRPVLDATVTAPLGDEVRRILDVVGPLVAADTAHDLTDDLVGDLDATLVNGPVGTRVSLADRERDTEASRVIDDLLASPAWTTLTDRLERAVIDAPLSSDAGRKAKPVLRELVAEQDKAATEALWALDEAGPADITARRDDAARAALRVAVLGEHARVVHGKHARGLTDASWAVVHGVEELRQAEGAMRLLVDLADQAHRAGEPGFTYGRLHALAERSRDAAGGDLAAAVAAWSKPKRHKWLDD